MENGLAGQFVTGSRIPVTDDNRQTAPDSDIPCVNFDDLKPDYSYGIQNVATETVHGGKPSGKHDVSCVFMCAHIQVHSVVYAVHIILISSLFYVDPDRMRRK